MYWGEAIASLFTSFLLCFSFASIQTSCLRWNAEAEMRILLPSIKENVMHNCKTIVGCWYPQSTFLLKNVIFIKIFYVYSLLIGLFLLVLNEITNTLNI